MCRRNDLYDETREDRNFQIVNVKCENKRAVLTDRIWKRELDYLKNVIWSSLILFQMTSYVCDHIAHDNSSFRSESRSLFCYSETYRFLSWSDEKNRAWSRWKHWQMLKHENRTTASLKTHDKYWSDAARKANSQKYDNEDWLLWSDASSSVNV